MRAALVALALVALAGTARTAPSSTEVHATPTSELNRARKSFQMRDWASASMVLFPLLYPTIQLGTQDEVVEGFTLLGASYFEVGNRTQAQVQFERALQIDPDREITTNAFSEGAVHLFDETKAEMQRKAAADAERRKLADKIAALEEYRKHLVKVEVHPYYLNFVPFGAGQFQNQDRIKGLLFATGEGLTLAASVGSWLYLVNKYGINCPHCVAQNDRNTVLNLQQLEIGAGIAFFVLYGGGVIEALFHYKAEERVKGDGSALPDLRDLEKTSKKKTSFLDHLHVAPMIAPQGVGVGIGWEN